MELTPRPTIEIPRSLFIEYGQEVQAHKNWKTLVISEKLSECNPHNISEGLSQFEYNSHIISLNHIIGLGCQGNVYDADSNHYGKVVVKELKGQKPVMDFAIHYIASDLGIGPDVYDICYDSSKSRGEALTYVVFEKLDRMISYKDMCNQNIAYQVCECITRLIENGIFHNDIRSTNIMLNDKGQVQLIDYDYSTLAFGPSEYDSTTIIPYITAKKYDELLKKNYTIVLDEKPYTIAFPYEMQERQHIAREKFMDLLVKSFLLGVGYD